MRKKQADQRMEKKGHEKKSSGKKLKEKRKNWANEERKLGGKRSQAKTNGGIKE